MAVAARLVKLECNGEANGREDLEVPPTGALIGRKDTCNIKLEHPIVSGEQCFLSWNSHESQFQIEDKSSNGTFVNDKLIGRGNSCRLVHGDIVRLTKRKETGLLYRFEIVAAAAPHPVEHRLAEPSMLPAPTTSAAVCSDHNVIHGLRCRLAAEEQRLSDFSFELAKAGCSLSQLRQATTFSGGACGSGQGVSAAEQDALHEAERTHLMRQRSVLENELMQRQADHEKLELALRRTEAAGQQACEERARLEDELQKTIAAETVLSGQNQGYQEHLVELEKKSESSLFRVHQVRSLTPTLEADLRKAQTELAESREKEQDLERKAQQLQEQLESLTKTAAGYTEKVHCTTQELSSCLEASCSTPARPAPAVVAAENSGLLLQVGGENAQSPAPSTVPATVTLHAEEPSLATDQMKTDADQKRLKQSAKENMSPCPNARRRSSGSSAPSHAAEGSPARRISSRAAGGALTTGGEVKRRRVKAEDSFHRHRTELDDDPLESATPTTPGPYRPLGHPAPKSAVPVILPGAIAAAAAARRARPQQLWSSSTNAAFPPRTMGTVIEDLCSPEC